MRILKMRATFGVLDNRELVLHEGMNLIDAPNESGKSTWCAFIRAMLYGVDTAARERAGVTPAPLRYAPWSGAPMAGEMELLWQGRSITIRRHTKTANAPMREFSAVYTGTAEPVPGLTGATAGEMLTGVPRAVFERSAYVSQGGLVVTAGPELEKRISAIVSTGDETGASYTQADERLRAWQRKRYYNRKGSIPACEEELRQTEQQLELLAQGGDSRQRDVARVQALEQARRDLEPRLAQARAEERRAALQRLTQEKGRLREAEQADCEAGTRLEQARQVLAAHPFAGEHPESLRRHAAEDLHRCETLAQAAGQRCSPAPVILLFLAAAVFTVLALLLKQAWLLLPAAAWTLGAVLRLRRMQGLRRAAEEAAEARQKLLAFYDADSPEAITAMVDAYADAVAQVGHLQQEKRRAEAVLAALRLEQQGGDAAILQDLDFQSGDSPAAQLTRELARLDAQLSLAREESARQSGRLGAMGDPLVLGSRREFLLAERERLTEEFEALSLAIETLREANSELQSRFSPRLGAMAGRYYAALTAGRYTGLQLDRDFRATVQKPEDTVARESAFLSAGALDQMYLALRLAVCQLALNDSGSCPLILDDSLVNFDPARTQLALELLEEIARTRQVIVFSCRPLPAERS